MTRRSRMLDAIRYDDVDKVPWAPKMFFPYYLRAQDQKYRDMDWGALADDLNVEMLVFDDVIEPRYAKTVFKREEKEDKLHETWETPVGKLTRTSVRTEESGVWHPFTMPIRSLTDLRAMNYLVRDTRYVIHSHLHSQTVEQVGDRGIVLTNAPSSPLMELVQAWMGLEFFYYCLYDNNDALVELMNAMEERNRNAYGLMSDVPDVEIVVPVENTSTTITSPPIFRQFCLPSLKTYREIVKAKAKIFILHMCGHLKALLEDIASIEADSVEAYSPPPIGNASIEDARKPLGNKTSIMGGLNAVLLDQWNDEAICKYVRKTVHRVGKRGLILTSGGVMPPRHQVPRLKTFTKKLRKTLDLF